MARMCRMHMGLQWCVRMLVLVDTPPGRRSVAQPCHMHVACMSRRSCTCVLRCMRPTGAPHFRDTVEAAAERARQLCFETYGCAPAVRVAGDTAAHLPYVWGHLDYILFELLKNSLRAVVERQCRGVGSGGGTAAAGVASGSLEVVTVRICQAPEAITIQVSDRGGGLLPEVRNAVWQYGFSTIDRGSGDGGGAGDGAVGVHPTRASVCVCADFTCGNFSGQASRTLCDRAAFDC